jgi:hypothetical protein
MNRKVSKPVVRLFKRLPLGCFGKSAGRIMLDSDTEDDHGGRPARRGQPWTGGRARNGRAKALLIGIAYQEIRCSSKEKEGCGTEEEMKPKGGGVFETLKGPHLDVVQTKRMLISEFLVPFLIRSFLFFDFVFLFCVWFMFIWSDALLCLCLTESYGYKKEDIVIMVDKKGVRPELLPTKENIVRHFCLLLVFFSCPQYQHPSIFFAVPSCLYQSLQQLTRSDR